MKKIRQVKREARKKIWNKKILLWFLIYIIFLGAIYFLEDKFVSPNFMKLYKLIFSTELFAVQIFTILKGFFNSLFASSMFSAVMRDDYRLRSIFRSFTNKRAFGFSFFFYALFYIWQDVYIIYSTYMQKDYPEFWFKPKIFIITVVFIIIAMLFYQYGKVYRACSNIYITLSPFRCVRYAVRITTKNLFKVIMFDFSFVLWNIIPPAVNILLLTSGMWYLAFLETPFMFGIAFWYQPYYNNALAIFLKDMFAEYEKEYLRKKSEKIRKAGIIKNAE